MTAWAFLVVTCAAVILIRFGLASATSGPGAWLSATLVALFPALALQLPGVIAAVDGPTIPGLANALANAFTIPALALATSAFQLTVDPAGRRAKAWLTASIVVAGAIVVTFLAFGSNYPEFLAALDTARPIPPVGVYTYVYVLSLLWIAVGPAGPAVRLVLLRRPRLSVRVSLALLALGSAGTIAYGVARLAAITTYQLGFYLAFLHGPLIGLLMRLCVTTLLLGLLVAALGPRLGLDRWQEGRALRRAFDDLFPLWSALRDRYPEIVLDRAAGTPKVAVYRRMIEIWDGLLLLRPHMDQPTTAPHPRAEAERIARALATSQIGTPGDVTAQVAARRPDELAWLARVSREFSRVTA